MAGSENLLANASCDGINAVIVTEPTELINDSSLNQALKLRQASVAGTKPLQMPLVEALCNLEILLVQPLDVALRHNLLRFLVLLLGLPVGGVQPDMRGPQGTFDLLFRGIFDVEPQGLDTLEPIPTE